MHYSQSPAIQRQILLFRFLLQWEESHWPCRARRSSFLHIRRDMFVRDNLTFVNCCFGGRRGGWVQEMAREGILLVGRGLLCRGRVVIPRLLEEELFWGA